MGGMRVKRMLWLLLCLAALLTACGQKTAAQAKAAADPAVAAAQRYQSMVQAVGDGMRAGVDLTDAQIAQAVAQLSDAGLTAVHVDAADPVTHPETVTAFWDARAAGQTAEAALYEVCRDGGLLCHTLRFADGTDTVTRTRVVWRDGAFSVSYTDTYAVTSLTLDGGRLTYVYDMPDNPPGTDHDQDSGSGLERPLEEYPCVHVVEVIFVGNELDQLQRHHKGENCACDGDDHGFRQVLYHAENAAVPCLRR